MKFSRHFTAWNVAMAISFAATIVAAEPETSVPPETTHWALGPRKDIREDVEKMRKMDIGKATPEQQAWYMKTYGEAMWRGSQVDNRHYKLSGAVVDMEGLPLDGVTMIAVKLENERPTGESDGLKHTTAIDKIVGNEFDEEVVGGINVQLRFKKDGYYETRCSIQRGDGPGVSLDEMFGSQPIPMHVVQIDDLRAVMQKIGQPTNLTSLKGPLSIESDGSGQVLRMVKASGGNKPQQDHFENIETAIATENDLVYLSADRDADTGAFHVKQVVVPSSNGGNQKVTTPQPVNVTISFVHDDAGFLPWSMPDGLLGPYTNAIPSRLMTTAPQAGYGRELKFDMHNKPQPRYFFFKYGTRYGKGYVSTAPYMSYQQDRIECFITFRLQPDGSRNVETND